MPCSPRSYNARAIPPQYKGLVDVDALSMTYVPWTWYNNFWLLRDYLLPMNATVEEVVMHISLEPINKFKFAFFVQVRMHVLRFLGGGDPEGGPGGVSGNVEEWDMGVGKREGGWGNVSKGHVGVGGLRPCMEECIANRGSALGKQAGGWSPSFSAARSVPGSRRMDRSPAHCRWSSL